MRKPVVLITGAGGEIGHGLIDRLSTQKERAIVTLDVSPLESTIATKVDREITGSILDRSVLERILAEYQVELVIHLAALLSTRSEFTPMTAHQVNVEGTRCVAQTALRAGVRMVHVSSVDALGGGTRNDPGTEERQGEDRVPCPYVVTKRVGEETVLDLVRRGLDAVIVNPGFMLGPWDWKPSSGRMIRAARPRAIKASLAFLAATSPAASPSAPITTDRTPSGNCIPGSSDAPAATHTARPICCISVRPSSSPSQTTNSPAAGANRIAPPATRPSDSFGLGTAALPVPASFR